MTRSEDFEVCKVICTTCWYEVTEGFDSGLSVYPVIFFSSRPAAR
ncbi:hypothetical protein NKH77_46480 [Streptomyces sp. M19]